LDLIIVGDNWWLERKEYDGSEWFEFKKKKKEPDTVVKITKIPEDFCSERGMNKWGEIYEWESESWGR
jgi:hypothetical protein